MLTQEQKQNLAKVFDANADKQLSLAKVVDTTAKALCTDVLTASWVKEIIGESRTEERKHFFQVFALMMPHYILNGTDEAVICDFVALKEDNQLTKTIRQFRVSVDDEIVKPENCTNYVETKKETNKTEMVTLASGYQLEVPSRDLEGNLIKETVKVQLVPRKKAVWGYTKDVKTAIINAIEYIENEAK